MALFDPSPRTATATAVSETRLAGLKNESLNSLLRTRPEVSAQLLQALARRLRRTNDSLSDLVFSDVPGRVAKALLDLADRFGRPATDGVLVAHELTQEELAQLVGASRETVNKALAEFVQRGLAAPRSPRRCDFGHAAPPPALPLSLTSSKGRPDRSGRLLLFKTTGGRR
jgi:CRP/FNR family cyclic AMP-dependent transcriptional regulator